MGSGDDITIPVVCVKASDEALFRDATVTLGLSTQREGAPKVA